MPLAPGTRIDEYEVQGLLGAGGMGEVYRARDLTLKREAAIKVLPVFVAQDADRLHRFENEARAVAALNHPNILVIYRFGSYGGAPYLASELLEGTTLRQRLERGPTSVRASVDICVQIARGLAAAHDKGIVHRDLKPENLFLTKDSRTKILDFGLAKLMAQKLHEDHTTVTPRTDPGMVLGTVGYMSPEQVRGLEADHRADIFAFGAIIYEMLTGKQPFRRATAAETMAAILNEDPPDMLPLAPRTPPGLQRVVVRCLEKDPEQRFHSASDLAFALEALSDSNSSVPSSPVPTQRAAAHRFRMVLWIAGAVVVLAIGILVLSWQRKEPRWRVTGYTQLTHSGKFNQVVATDGVRIYLSRGTGHPIGQLAVTGGEVEPLTQLPANISLEDVSPDGTTLLYRLYGDSNPAEVPFYTLQLLGGSPRYLVSAYSAAWNPDGKSLLYARANGDVFQVNSDGTGAHKVISTGDAAINPYNLRMSPDLKRIRYLKNGALWESTSNGAGLHQLFQNRRPSQFYCCPDWSPDGSLFIFLASDGQIHAVDEQGSLFHQASEQPFQLTSGPIGWGKSVFSKDGKKIYSSGATPRGELIRWDGRVKQFLPFLDGISADLLSFSKNGQLVAYSTYPDGVVWGSRVDGTRRVQLSDASLFAEWVNLSPDGSQVLFMAPESSGSALTRAYVVSTRGDRPRLLLPRSAGPEVDPSWSPDGHKIVFSTSVGGDETRPGDIRVLDVDSQQITVLPDSKGKYSAHWSPDGRFLLAESADDSAINLFELKMNRWVRLYQGISAYSNWSHDSRFVYALRYGAHSAVLKISVESGIAEVIVDLKNVNSTGTFGIWLGLDPSDSPLLLRDVGTSDVYALDIKRQ